MENVTIYEQASPLEPGIVEYKTVAERISSQSPNFKKRAENKQLGDSILFKTDPVGVKLLDFTAVPQVEEFALELQRVF